MKIKVTRNQLKDCFIDIYNISYCGIQDIENYLNCIMYTCGVYGWKSDIYDCHNGYAISTGYGPCGNKYINRDIYTKYNKRFSHLKNKTSIKAIQYLQDMIQEQKQRESEKEFNTLCRKIEIEINKAYVNQWSKENLEFYHQTFFPSYDESEYMTVYYDGYYSALYSDYIIPSDIQNIIIVVAPKQAPYEIEIDLNSLSNDILRCSNKQLEKLKTNYNVNLTDVYNIVAYQSLNGFYAIIKNKDFNASIFNCGVLPYDVQEV